jgi:hypothetical protein
MTSGTWHGIWDSLRIPRTILAWLAVAAVTSLYVSTLVIEPRYPTNLAYAGGPRAPEWMYVWRVASLYVAGITSLLSLPRWQSLVALLALFVHAFFFAGL